MLKKAFSALVLCFVVFVVYSLTNSYLLSDPVIPSFPQFTPSPTPIPFIPPTITHNEVTYSYGFLHLTPQADIELHPNYATQTSAKDLIEQYGCTHLVNGGFYSQNHQPIGLVIANQQQLSAYEPNQLFNGFLSLESNTPSIQTNIPGHQVEFALQSGPLLITNGVARQLTLNKDESRRRIVAALDSNQQLVFIAVYNPNTPYGGPLLAELPQLVTAIFAKESVTVVSAINLDGGTASAFYVKDGLFLQDLKPIGSFFCIKSP